MSVELNLPGAADLQLIVTALHIAGGALPADHLTRVYQDRKQTGDKPTVQVDGNARSHRSEAQQRCLRLAFEISAGLLALQHRQELARITRRRAPHPTAGKPLSSPPSNPRMAPNAQV